MIIFIYEFLHFLAASLAILVSVSSAALFIITFRYERKLQTGWRALGFLFLALAYLFFIFERKYPGLEIFALFIETIALFSIFKGVLAEPKLIHLRKVSPPSKTKKTSKKKKEEKNILTKILIFILVIIILFAILYVPGVNVLSEYLPALLGVLSVIFIILTIIIQVKRYRTERDNKKKIRQNLYPLIGYIFLLIRGITLIFYRLPELDLVFFRNLSLEYSWAWIIGLIATFIAFIYLWIWAWNFVKVRVFLRTYVVFISIVIVVATIGSLIFTLFIFKVVENNNLDLMLKGAETQTVIMSDRANTASFVAKLVSEDNNVVQYMQSNSTNLLQINLEDYLESANVDILRVYNVYGEVLASPSDPRDIGRVFPEDSLLAFVLSDKKVVRSFDLQPGVLTDFIITRAMHPIMSGEKVVGAVEVGYKFDNAFVDFSKERTNLDVTIYSGKKISATTIKTLDGVSRFVGSEEVSPDILVNVLVNGENYKTVVDRFGDIYYSAYKPLRNVNGEIIGMVSVGIPTFYLIDNTRQQLLTTFILVSILSLLVSLIGYYGMPNLRVNEKQKKTKK